MSPRRNHLPASLLLLACLVLAVVPGCSSEPKFVLDSDIPEIPGMQQRLGFDIKRSAGDITNGVFIFVGPLMETEQTMKTLATRFRNRGWELKRETPGFPRAVLVFTKGDRQVEVVLDADQLEPAMSRGQYVVSERDDGVAPKSEQTDTTG